MGLAEYAIVAQGDGWGILHDGSVENKYANKQAAFESAVSAASAAIRQGHEIHISVPSAEAGVGNAMGNKDHGPDIQFSEESAVVRAISPEQRVAVVMPPTAAWK